MKRLIIIVEGQTEEEFVKSLLCPYLAGFRIYDVRAIKIQTSRGYKGGLVNYEHFRRDIWNILKREQEVVVTSLVDFFRMPTNFPGYVTASKITDAAERADFLQSQMVLDISDRRFLPYLQLHEMEGLFFADINGFKYLGNIISEKAIDEINGIIKSYPNPELINDGSETAPSKRLAKIIPGYQKVLHGPVIALENGIGKILEKCPRFNAWVEKCVGMLQSEEL